MTEARKKTAKRTVKKTAPAKPLTVAEKKREDAESRLAEKKAAGHDFGLDAHDPLLGWDAQQRKTPPGSG